MTHYCIRMLHAGGSYLSVLQEMVRTHKSAPISDAASPCQVSFVRWRLPILRWLLNFGKIHAPPVKTIGPLTTLRQQPRVFHDFYLGAAVRGSTGGSQHVWELEFELSFSPDEHFTN